MCGRYRAYLNGFGGISAHDRLLPSLRFRYHLSCCMLMARTEDRETDGKRSGRLIHRFSVGVTCKNEKATQVIHLSGFVLSVRYLS